MLAMLMITQCMLIMDRNSSIYIGFMVGLFCMNAELQAGMIDKDGMEPWEVCGMCHSLDGVSKMPKFPKLAGQKAAYLTLQLADFRHERRTNDNGQMASIVTEINPLDIESIVGYFSGLPRPAPESIIEEGVEKADHQTGKLLFEEGRPGVDACSSCHNLVHPTAPFLQAQHADYIRKQLNDFKQGQRVGSRAAVMTSIAGLLSGDEIDAVADYLQSSGR